jgi:hypothetical protein
MTFRKLVHRIGVWAVAMLTIFLGEVWWDLASHETLGSALIFIVASTPINGWLTLQFRRYRHDQLREKSNDDDLPEYLPR